MTSEDHNVASGDLDLLLNEHFAGKIVRKDLTKLVKEGANVPVFVLEYLLGNYCSSQDEEIVEEGLQTVKRLLLPMASVGDISTVPGELFAKFQTSFYADPRDAVFKALGVQ